MLHNITMMCNEVLSFHDDEMMMNNIPSIDVVKDIISNSDLHCTRTHYITNGYMYAIGILSLRGDDIKLKQKHHLNIPYDTMYLYDLELKIPLTHKIFNSNDVVYMKNSTFSITHYLEYLTITYKGNYSI